MSLRLPGDLSDDLPALVARLIEDRLNPGDRQRLAEFLSSLNQGSSQALGDQPNLEADSEAGSEAASGAGFEPENSHPQTRSQLDLERLSSPNEVQGDDLLEPLRCLVGSTLKIGRRLDSERAVAATLIHELASLQQAERLRRIRADARFVTWGVAESLLRGSDETPALGVDERAELALEIADRLPPGTYSRELLADLQASAYANWSRVKARGDDLVGAEKAIRLARDLLRRGTGEPALRGRVLETAADLARRRGRRSVASVYYERAADCFAASDQGHEKARCLWARAGLLKEIGDLEGSLNLLRSAVETVDSERDRGLAIEIWHDLARAQLARGLLTESRTALRRAKTESMRLARHDPADADSHRESNTTESVDRWPRRWIEGRLAAAEGRIEEAEAALHEARRTCLDEGRPRDALRIGLDLASVLIEEGREDSLERFVGDLSNPSALSDLGGAPTAALTLFLATARQGAATASIAQELERYLGRL